MTASDRRRSAQTPLETGTARSHARQPRHARQQRAARIRVGFGLAAAAVLVLGGTAAVTAAVSGRIVSDVAGQVSEGSASGDRTGSDGGAAGGGPAGESHGNAAPATTALPVPTMTDGGEPSPQASDEPFATPVPLADPCNDSGFVAALDASDDAEVIALSGGAELFRALVASGRAACVPLDDPTFAWVVVNKHRPYDPVDYRPAKYAAPNVPSSGPYTLEKSAARALGKLAAAAQEAGAGRISLASGFRSYESQRSIHGGQVAARGRDYADQLSARAGHSEHQSGLAADIVACNAGCGSIYSFEGTRQQKWMAENAWRYGWIIRYEDGATDVTGYQPEPWHLRYVGKALAKAYHDGGWHTLEEFFGLDPAPDYAD